MAEVNVKNRSFGKLADGDVVLAYELVNKRGMSVTLINYGAIIQSLKVPDKEGNPVDIVLGYDSLEGYLKDTYYFGATIGRYANRIANGEFRLDGKTYKLAKNDNNINHLHGGNKGFSKRLWNSEVIKKENKSGVKLLILVKYGRRLSWQSKNRGNLHIN